MCRPHVARPGRSVVRATGLALGDECVCRLERIVPVARATKSTEERFPRMKRRPGRVAEALGDLGGLA